MKPKWARPLFGDNSCSICDNSNVYYSQIDYWEEELVLANGVPVAFLNMGMKCYCKDCFEDCGGHISGFKNFF